MFTDYLTVKVAKLVTEFCDNQGIDIKQLHDTFSGVVGSEYMLDSDSTNDWYIVPALYWFCVDYHSGQNCFLYSFKNKLEYNPGTAVRNVYDEIDESTIQIYEWILTDSICKQA